MAGHRGAEAGVGFLEGNPIAPLTASPRYSSAFPFPSKGKTPLEQSVLDMRDFTHDYIDRGVLVMESFAGIGNGMLKGYLFPSNPLWAGAALYMASLSGAGNTAKEMVDMSSYIVLSSIRPSYQ